jgi:hypothetical protein
MNKACNMKSTVLNEAGSDICTHYDIVFQTMS